MNLRLSIVVALLVLGVCGGCGTRIPPPVTENTSPAGHFEPAHPQEWMLSNGLTVFFFENREIPMIRGSLLLPAGTFWESVKKPVSITAMGSLLRDGGAGSRGADALDLFLEDRAIGVDSSFGSEVGSITFNGLSSDAETIFSVFSDVVRRPRFEQSRLDLWKVMQREAIIRRKEESEIIANTTFSQILFNQQLSESNAMASQTFGQVTLTKDIDALSRDDLVGAWKSMVFPKGAYLTLTGALSRSDAEKLIIKFFGDWKSDASLPPLPVPVIDAKPGIYFVKGPFAQASVIAGQKGVRRLTKDDIAIDAFNQVLGGGSFTSKLVKEVRTKRGLAYVVQGGMSKGRQAGANLISIGTKGSSVGEALSAGFDVLREMQSEVVPDSELSLVKRSIENSFVFNYASLQGIAEAKAMRRLTGYPDSYDDTYVAHLHEVQPADIQRIAKSYWNPKAFVVVVVGDDTAYTSLKELLRNPPPELEGLPFQTLSFDERAYFPKS